MLEKRDWLMNTMASLANLRVGIPRVIKPSSDEFLDRYYASHRPVIIEHAFNDWPALQKWSLPYFRARFADRMIETQMGRNSEPNFEVNNAHLRKKIPFGDVLNHIEKGPSNDIYLTARNNETNGSALAELWDDIKCIDEYLKPEPGRQGFLWFGPEGTITPLHHDLTNNFMAQVIGRKRVLMAPSYAVPNMYNHSGVFTNVDHRRIDYEQFPLMRNVNVMECIIGPGDLLFLPIAWWHAVESLDVSATMTFTNFKWRNDFHSTYPRG